jgi:hypothetical protein
LNCERENYVCMTIKEAKNIDMVTYLSMMGLEPAKVTGVNYWYYSPLRSEQTPSFKINRCLNRWYDFGVRHDVA